MKTPKTLTIIECRRCGGAYFGGDQKLTLVPGDEHELPDELAIVLRKVARCVSCQEQQDRTHGGPKKRFER